MSIFDLETDDQIKEFMQGEGKNLSKPYMELSRRIPNFSSKQLCHRWNYKLNPRLTDGPFTQEEKEFIYKWVNENTTASGKVRWSHCQKALENKFDKFRAVNRIQGMWLTHCRHLEHDLPKVFYYRKRVKTFNTPLILPKANPSGTKNAPIAFSNVPILRPRPRLPALIPNYQPEINVPKFKMLPLF
ncbi:11598_t:CDS:2 [Funneliformis mosseae]|uniref:11598_t:CDS:1 n=1 Tax=Funneliformis mosseae TaxID=27381 RepID=A0A9N9G1V9_FUNMO|nr:11598_t:CDS:2 [Funneliformis mosseae]